jgi:hypothetical protein
MLYVVKATEPHDEASLLHASYDSMLNYEADTGTLNFYKADSYKTAKRVTAVYLRHYATQRPKYCTHIEFPYLI